MTENPQISQAVPTGVEVQAAPATPAPVPEAPRVVLEDGNDISDGIVPDVKDAPKPRMKRRDLLEVSALLRRNKLDPQDTWAMGLGVQYLSEKKAGETQLSFSNWLEEDLPDDEDDETEGEDGSDPTQA